VAKIVLENVTKTFTIEDTQITALRDVNLSLKKGEFISIVGHSGSGKTTLLSIIGGILRPTSGKLYFDQTDIYGLDEDSLAEYRATSIGYVFQFATLLPVLTAKENLLLPTLFSPNGRPLKEPEKRAEEYLALVGLAEKINAYPHQLSGGQQRRVAIARALMNLPQALLADEPTGDLDEETEAEVMDFFKKVNREMGLTFILVTHSTELAKVAGRKFRMTNGVFKEEGK
jgi:ABC-type lipoprotein export system ATPase subunit